MDYNLIYNEFYNQNYLRFEKIIKNRLIKSKAQKLNFASVSNEIRNYLSAYYSKKIDLLKDNKLEDLYNIFQKRYTYFEIDHIEEIFKNKIEKEFNKLITHLNYTLNDLIKDIALLEIANEIGRLLQIHSSLFDLFYKANNFEDFEIKEYGHIALENVPIFKKLNKKVNPNYYNNNSYYSFEDNQFELLNNKLDLKKQIFELDEQLLILNLCLEDKNSIPLTEKSKLIILIGEITEDNLFKVPSSNSKTYSKISNGIWRQGSKKTMIQIIDSILTKIENYNLTTTNQTLKKHRATLKNEQKNT